MQGSRGSQSVVEALEVFSRGFDSLFSNANDCHSADGTFCGEGGSAGSTVTRRVDAQIPEASKIQSNLIGHDGYLVQTKGTFKTKGPWRTAPVYPADMREHVVDHVKTMLTLGTRVRVNGQEITLTQDEIDSEERRIMGTDKSNANDCHDAADGRFCEGGGAGSGSGTSRPSVAIKREGKAWKTADGKDLPKHLDGLKIPPAWTDTKVNPDPEGSLLVTGYDSKGRLQYVYSPKFMDTQKAAKFERINELDRQFDAIKTANEGNRDDPAKAEEADCLHVIMETGIRPGSDRDTKGAVQAFGATTLRGEHVVQTDTGVRLQYVGKKGVSLDIPIDNPDTASMLTERATSVGPDGRLFDTDAHTLLQYTHTLGSGDFKVKDFRTLVGTSMAKSEIAKIPAPTTKTGFKKAVSQVAKSVSRKLGNTPSVALKSYIAPEVFDGWNAGMAQPAAKSNMDGAPLFDFDIMVGTACKLRERPVSIRVTDDDPYGNDEDVPCPPEVRMALGFDPDELDSDKSNACVGEHCFFCNNVSLAPNVHTAIAQGLNEWIDYKRPTGPQRFYYGVDDFTGTEQTWLTSPLIFAQQHPAHRLVASNLDEALKSVRAYEGGPGRVVGRIKQAVVKTEGSPRLETDLEFDDPVVERLHKENRLALSSAFTAGHDDQGRLTEKVKGNHMLLFVRDERNQPRDPKTMFLNKEGNDVTDEIDETAPADDKSAQPPVKPVAKAPSSTEVRLKALIGDLLKKLDQVFGSAEQLSEEAGDPNDPDPAVSGKQGQPQDGTPGTPAKIADTEKKNQAPSGSWEASQAVLAEAVSEVFGSRDPNGFGAWIEATFDDKLVYRADGNTFEVPYSIGVDGEVEFGDPVRVETEYTPVEEKANADYPWDQCIEDQIAKGYSEERAARICGYIKAKNNLSRSVKGGQSPNGADSEEDIMGTEMDALKSKLDAANQTVTAKTTELDDTKKQLDAANKRLAEFEQAQKDTAWANMRDTHVPKGWLAGADDAAKANKEADLRKEFESNPVGFANKLLAEAKGKGGQDKSKEEGAAFGNKGADGSDPIALSRELHALSGR